MPSIAPELQSGLCEIHSLLRLDDGSSISYVPRETNQTADCFAKDIYDLLPSFACNAFRADLAGVCFP